MDNTGAYSHSLGARCFREDDVTKCIQEHDGGLLGDPGRHLLAPWSVGLAGMNQHGPECTALIANDRCGMMILMTQNPI
jgi:hypothetical protein